MRRTKGVAIAGAIDLADLVGRVHCADKLDERAVKVRWSRELDLYLAAISCKHCCEVARHIINLCQRTVNYIGSCN